MEVLVLYSLGPSRYLTFRLLQQVMYFYRGLVLLLLLTLYQVNQSDLFCTKSILVAVFN